MKIPSVVNIFERVRSITHSIETFPSFELQISSSSVFHSSSTPMDNKCLGFAQPILVSTHRVAHIGRTTAPICSLRPGQNTDTTNRPDQQSSPKPFLPRLIRPARISAAAVAAAGALLGVAFSPFTPSAPLVTRAVASSRSTSSTTTSKQLRYDGRQELDSREKAMSLTLTAGTFAVLGVWAWKKNRRDDELENVRIKDEVERLEKLRAEFMDVEDDGGSIDDEDLLASLKQRISEGDDTSTNPDESEDPSDLIDDADTETTSRGSSSDTVNTESPNSESIDALKRMWDATDSDKKDTS